MPDRLDVSGLGLCIVAEPLTQEAFAAFGDVIENPRPDVQPSAFGKAFSPSPNQHPFRPVSANQGSAIKYQHVSRPADLYASASAPSGRPATAVTNMFVCAARELAPEDGLEDPSSSAGLFPVTILERHPYTTQTFVPLTAGFARYLVIVAPTVDKGQPADRFRLGPPDVTGLRAFVARGDQAVTYGAGTWHGPMAALGPIGTSVTYAVFQFANGVGLEDCQEIELDSGAAGGQGKFEVTVRVPVDAAAPPPPRSCPFASKL